MAEPLDLEPSLPCTAVAYKKGFHNKKVLVQIPRDWKVFFFPLSHHVTIVILFPWFIVERCFIRQFAWNEISFDNTISYIFRILRNFGIRGFFRGKF